MQYEPLEFWDGFNINLYRYCFFFYGIENTLKEKERIFLGDMKGHAAASNGAVTTGAVIVFAGVAFSYFVCVMKFLYLSETKHSALPRRYNHRYIPQVYRIYLLDSGY
jgi:hypothetical protein